MIWTETKINYVFIFEFDSRTALDFRQLMEVSCLFGAAIYAGAMLTLEL